MTRAGMCGVFIPEMVMAWTWQGHYEVDSPDGSGGCKQVV